MVKLDETNGRRFVVRSAVLVCRKSIEALGVHSLFFGRKESSRASNIQKEAVRVPALEWMVEPVGGRRVSIIDGVFFSPDFFGRAYREDGAYDAERTSFY